MKKLIVLISVLVMSSMIFADADWTFKGKGGFRATYTNTKPDGGDATNDVTWKEEDIAAEVDVTNGDVSGYAKISAEGDVWASLKVSDAFTIKMGKFGRPSYKVGGSKGPYHLQKANFGPGGGGQVELAFSSDPSTFKINLFNMKPAADNAVGAINTVAESGDDIAFTAVTGFSHEAFIPEIQVTYEFKNDMIELAAGGDMHMVKLIKGDDETQLVSFGAGAKICFKSGIFGIGAAGCYVVNPAVIGGVGDRGFSKLSYKLGETSGDLVNNNFIGFAADLDLKLGEVVDTEVGFGYGFNTMDIEGFENDAHMSGHLQFKFTALEAIEMIPEVGFDQDIADYNGNKGDMTFYVLLNNKISF